ncbi:substrate-binding domain-containing protein [Fimbriiglobus ruber]|nr:substrate-binding domain-containing protein [Fimbriiglobus ruber]
MKYLRLFAILAAGFAAAGCIPSSPSPVKRTIGLSVLSQTNPFFMEIADNLREEAVKHGFDVIVVSGENDVARQDKQLNDFVARNVDAIVLSPCDSKSIGPAIRAANAAGIPVFTVDIAVLAPDAKVVTHIATDNYAGGKQAGEAMIEALGGRGGKVGVLDLKAVESCILRVKGFKEVIDANNQKPGAAKIEIVSELPCGGAKDQGYKSAEDMLQAHADLAAIFAINDPAALGARAALEKAGKAERIKLIGFDGQPEGKRAIAAGKIYADPIQYPDKIGRTAATVIAKYFDGEEVAPEVLIPTALYRKADGERDGLKP